MMSWCFYLYRGIPLAVGQATKLVNGFSLLENTPRAGNESTSSLKRLLSENAVYPQLFLAQRKICSLN